jgi:hypothetical protein
MPATAQSGRSTRDELLQVVELWDLGIGGLDSGEGLDSRE